MEGFLVALGMLEACYGQAWMPMGGWLIATLGLRFALRLGGFWGLFLRSSLARSVWDEYNRLFDSPTEVPTCW